MVQRTRQVSRRSQMPERQSGLHATDGEVFPDGTILELVLDAANPTQIALLHWDGKRSTIAREITIDGRRYIPVDIASPLLQRLRLPSKPRPYGSTPQLFTEAKNLLAKFSGLTDNHASLAAYFCLGSFFSGYTGIAPCLLLSGSQAEAIAFLRILGWICRHSVLLANPGLHGLPEELKPTRLICQADPSIEKLLAPLQLPGFRIYRNGSLQEICSATAIYVGEGELQGPFADSCLRIPIPPSGRLLSASDELGEGAAIARLQDKLLCYRLTNFARVKSSGFDVPEFSGSLRELVRSLGACIVDAPELQARLVGLLQPHDDALRTDRASNVVSVLLEALVMLCHQRKGSVHVGEVARVTNEIFSLRGDSLTFSAREAGGKMKSLGFCTTRLDAGGRGVYLLTENCRRIHEVARCYGVAALRKGLSGCPHCRQVLLR